MGNHNSKTFLQRIGLQSVKKEYKRATDLNYASQLNEVTSYNKPKPYHELIEPNQDPNIKYRTGADDMDPELLAKISKMDLVHMSQPAPRVKEMGFPYKQPEGVPRGGIVPSFKDFGVSVFLSFY
jgi:hypothetical protein